MRLASYIRTSGDKAESTSLESQIERIKAKCLLDGHTISGEFFDKESGESMTKRQGFQDALAFVKSGNADGLIVYKLDRFARSLCDGVRVINDFKNTGKALVCCADPIDTTSALGQAFFQIAMVFAELERKTITQRCVQGRSARATQLRYAGGPPPYGFRNIVENGIKQLVEDEQEQQIIGEIKSMHEAGQSTPYIATYLNQRGILSKRGKEWHPSVVRRVISGFSVLQHWIESGQNYNYLESSPEKPRTERRQAHMGRNNGAFRDWVVSLGAKYRNSDQKQRLEIRQNIVEKTGFCKDYILRLLRAGAKK